MAPKDKASASLRRSDAARATAKLGALCRTNLLNLSLGISLQPNYSSLEAPGCSGPK